MIATIGKSRHIKTMDASTKTAKSLRNAENRRLKSKVAARCRRGEETKIFHDLSSFLPIPDGVKSHLDKVSVVRLTLCNLLLKKILPIATGGCLANENESESQEFDSQLHQALGGFILIFGLDGDVIYASSGISEHLGISESEIMGHSIFEFSHQYDHPEIRSMLLPKKSGVGAGDCSDFDKRSSLFRLKCSVASTRGRNDSHSHCSSYKMINCIGRLVTEEEEWFISICEPLLHPADGQLPPKNKTTWMSRHAPDMKFLGIDDIQELLGYEERELLGHSLFELSHAADGDGIGKAFKFLTDKEQNVTEPYRFLTQGGGWIWMVTQATLIHGSGCGGCANKSPDYVVCLHWTSGGREEPEAILAQVQIRPDKEEGSPNEEGFAESTSTSDLELLDEITRLEQDFRGNSDSVMTPDEENAIIADLLVVEPYFEGSPQVPEEDIPSNLQDDAVMTEIVPEVNLNLAPNSNVPMDVTLLQNLLASLDVDDILELETGVNLGMEGQNSESSQSEGSPIQTLEAGQGQDQSEGQAQGQQIVDLPVTESLIINGVQNNPVTCYVVDESGEVGPPPNKLQLMGVDSSEGIGGGEAGGLFMLVPVTVGGAGTIVGGPVGGTDSNFNSSPNSSDSLDSAGQLDLVNLVRAQQLQIAQQAEINRELLARIELIEEESGCGVRRNSIGKRNSDRSLVSSHPQHPTGPPHSCALVQGQIQEDETVLTILPPLE